VTSHWKARDFEVDYLEVRDRETLTLADSMADTVADLPLAVLAAAWLGRARLIDNVPVPA
jgi:pantothenate synthetase